MVLILGFCIIGIAASAGVIVVQNESYGDSRQAIRAEFMQLAKAAHEYRARTYEANGGDGTFMGLTPTPEGISKLTPTPSTPHAEFSILSSGDSHTVSILAVGKSPGQDVRRPIEMVMMVFEDTSAVVVLN
ncbi:MAG: hypothetical protein HY961_15670 [Ignavibacteriae bacterium]|nr:hypothetical protein [Ignavibacteriota bacterium]